MYFEHLNGFDSTHKYAFFSLYAAIIHQEVALFSYSIIGIASELYLKIENNIQIEILNANVTKLIIDNFLGEYTKPICNI